MINPKDIIQSSAPTANITVNATPITSIPTPKAATPVITTSDYTRPTFITSLLWILFLDLVYKIVNSILVITRLIASFRINHGLAHLYESSPALCFSPIVYALLALVVLFLIFKTTSYTRLEFYLLITFSIIVASGFTIFTRIISFYLNQNSTLIIFNETNLIILVILIFLLFLPKKFSSESIPLSDNSVILFTLLGSIIIFPSFFFTYSLINTSLNPDLKLISIQTLINHHIYSPTFLPLKLRPDTTFFIDDQTYPTISEPSVKIVYSTAISTVSPNRPMLIISQTAVPANFNLEQFTNSQLTNSTIPAEKVSLTNHPDQLVFIKKSNPNQNSKLNLTLLSTITSDNILITLTSPSTSITPDHLLSIANLLK